MFRKIDSRLRIDCTLVAHTPVHVGGIGGSADSDLALAVNGNGDYYIPGTSIAGALRGWLAARVGETEVGQMWGFQRPPAGREEGPAEGRALKDGHASRILIEDARVEAPGDGQVIMVEVRDGVGVDRFTGAAANQIKFDRAILPSGTQIGLEMVVELAAGEERTRALVYQMLRALQAGRIRLGAGKSRGLGSVKTSRISVWEQGMLRNNGLLDTLRGKGQPVDLATIHESTSVDLAHPQVMVSIAWRPCGPVMVKSGHDGVAVDMLPLVTGLDDHLTFVLAGSSIKGALRSQAERIVRTLVGPRNIRIVSRKQDFINQIELRGARSKGSKADSLIGWVFGIAARPGKEDDIAADPLPGLSALSADDCFARARFSPAAWSEVEQAEDEQDLQAKLLKADLSHLRQSFHVAIDRWLGGAADGMLYSVLEPHGVQWEPICLMLDSARLPDDKSRKRAVMLLLLVLRDLADGRIPMGFGANRGMGRIEVTGLDISVEGCEEGHWLSALQGQRLEGARVTVPEVLRRELNDAWRDWLGEQSLEMAL
jgi:CRISPR/Cas system CSM-associated protein Csm3 (group 7 of RAMP superfamily)